MSKIISYSDLCTRKKVREATTDVLVENASALCYKRLKAENSHENQIAFLRECAKSPAVATKYFSTIRGIVQETNNEAIKMCYYNEILPIVNIKESVNLPDDIATAIEKNRICDRIIENHYRIFKKDNIDAFIKKCLANDDKGSTILRKCCESVAEHKLPVYGKIIVSLEEFFYLSGKYGIVYEEKQIVDSAISYFFIRESVTSNDINKLRKSLDNSLVLEYNWKDPSEPDFEALFINSPVKNTDLLRSILSTVMDAEYEFDYLRDIGNFINLLSNTVTATKDDVLFSGIITEILPMIYEEFYKKYIDNERISSIITELISKLEYHISSSEHIANIPREDSLITSRCNLYKAALEELKEKLESLRDEVYTEYNLICMKDAVGESVKVITLEQHKIFGFNNLINAATKIDKYIASKFKNIHDTVRNKIKKVKNKIFGESTVFDSITVDGRVDYTVVSFEITDLIAELHEFFTGLCEDINKYQINDTGYRAYYVVECDTIKINLKSDEVIDMTDEEKEEFDKYMPEEERSLILDIGKYHDIQECHPFIIDDIVRFFSENRTNDNELFSTFLELAQYAGISKDTIQTIFESIGHRRHSFKDFYIRNSYLVECYNPLYGDLDITVEAVNTISDMIYEDANNDKNKVKEVVSGINLSNIKLVIAGLKKKFKDLSSKEQAASRQADVTFNRFITSIKNALVSDRREAIIKGSVIPSFSKCMKIGLTLVAMGIVAHNPFVPLIAAIGGLALSKKLTKKERVLLLDEIEIELEMIEKEIAMAESRNQMKKLRVLMRTKRDLQRQYQRIKYNIRVGKDLIPGSSGVPTRN